MLVFTCLQLFGRLTTAHLFPQKSKDFCQLWQLEATLMIFPCFTNFLKVFYGSWEICSYPLSIQQALGCLHKICLKKCLCSTQHWKGKARLMQDLTCLLWIIQILWVFFVVVAVVWGFLFYFVSFFILARYVQFSSFIEPEKLVTRPSFLLSQ